MENLKQEIEQKRREMEKLAVEKGFLAPEVLHISRELDQLIIQFIKEQTGINAVYDIIAP
ncbi:Spo0E family sporulation regulatory protein-aspartic acid phosphatase [Paenibacillus enshidis]|uniref:Spo0E family sporulation regulatory protein-aspartic acid phosphatase n=1 Tax=Paenibacillus enshidis TaxID=1458439 RepID=A0ABV5B050_9BACL